MSRSMQRKFSKVLPTFVFLLMLSGCGQIQSEESLPDSSDTAVAESVNKSETQPETRVPFSNSEDNSDSSGWTYTYEKLQELYPDKTVLTWVTCDIRDPAVLLIKDNVVKAVNDYLVSIGEDFVICYEAYYENDYEQEINNLIEEGKSPDIICGGIGQTEIGTVRILRNDWLMELDEYLTTEEGRKLFEAFPEKYWETLKFSNHYYGVVSLVENTDYAYFVNKDLMEKYNITKDMLNNCPLSQLGDILTIIKDGEGNNCKCLTLDNSLYDMEDIASIMEMHDITSDAFVFYLEDENPQVVNLFQNQEAVKWFKTILEYKKAGFLDGSGQSFILSRPFSRLANITSWKSIFKEEFGSADNVEIVFYDSGLIYPKGTITGVSRTSKHQEQALRALNLTMTDQVLIDLILYGPDRDEYINQDGFSTKKNYNMESAILYANLFARSPQLYEKDYPENYRFEVINETNILPQAGVLFDLSAYKNQINDIQKIVDEYRGLFYGSYENVDATIEELNEKLTDAGINEILGEINRQLAEVRQ